MIALLQRVLHASVSVDKKIIGEIKQGLLLFIGIEKKDNETKAELLVPQFTLAADTQKGTRPSFSSAATPELGQHLFDYVITQTRQQHDQLAIGKFGADMKVDLLNDGPVTFWLQV